MRRFATAWAVALVLFAPFAALATATVHVEWTRGGVVYGAQTLSATGSSVASSASPSCGAGGCQARITTLAGAATVAWGPSPTATQSSARLDVRENPLTVQLNTGDQVAILEATDAPAASHVVVDSGGGGGGGGAITAAAGSYASGALVDGASLTLGAQADAVCSTDSGTCSEIALLKRDNARLTSILSALGSPFQAGASIGNTTFAATSTVAAPTATPTIYTGGAYTAGAVFAPVMSFTVTNTGALANANVTLNSGGTAGNPYVGGFDLFLFNANPSNGTYTANGTYTLNATDAGLMIGVLHLTDCLATGSTTSQCQVQYQSQFYKLAAGTTIYAIAVIKAAPTAAFSGSTDAKFTLVAVQ